ncbi:MAG: hypothetical protein GX316_00685 [Firmicutes bacterium]|nr:hypothetical protein [Bacillota bacterium]
MYGITHVSVGALLGALWQNPFGAAVGGLVSHGILDAVPHHDYKTPVPALIDIGLSTAALYFLWQKGNTDPKPGSYSMFAGGLLAALPDVEIIMGYILDKMKKGWRWPRIYPSHTGLIRHGHMDFPHGFYLQAAVIVGCLLGIYLLKFRPI